MKTKMRWVKALVLPAALLLMLLPGSVSVPAAQEEVQESTSSVSETAGDSTDDTGTGSSVSETAGDSADDTGTGSVSETDGDSTDDTGTGSVPGTDSGSTDDTEPGSSSSVSETADDSTDDTGTDTDTDSGRDFRVASVNDVYYYSVAEALYFASDGDTIIMHADETLEDLIIPSELSVTLDLNGYSLTGSGETSVITVYGDLTIEDTEGTGVITGGTGTCDEVVYTDVTYISCYGGGIYVDGGSLTINGGTISGNTAVIDDTGSSSNSSEIHCDAGGGGIYVSGGSLTMNGGAVSSNTVSCPEPGSDKLYCGAEGGGIYLYESTFVMNGGTISYNTVSCGDSEYLDGDDTVHNTASGGGVYIYTGSLTMDSGRISYNTCGSGNGEDYSEGGGICALGNADLTLTGGTIDGNIASSGGGGIYVYDAERFYMADCTVSGNVAFSGAAGIYLSSVDEALISGGSISDNGTTDCGEGVRAEDTCLTIAGCKIVGNGEYGLKVNDGDLMIADSAISQNCGNGIFGNQASLTVTDSEISGNDDYGIFVYEGSLTIADSTISGNGGSGVLVSGSTVAMENGTVSENGSYGFDVFDGSTVTMNSGTVSENGSNGFCVSDESTFTMNGGEISANDLSGVDSDSSTFTMNDGKISANGSSGVYLDSSAFTMSGGTIRSNASTSTSGGGIYLNGSVMDITGGSVINNTGWNGGGIYVSADSTLTAEECVIANNTAEYWGADLYFNGYEGCTGSVTIGSSVNADVIYEADGKGQTIDGWYQETECFEEYYDEDGNWYGLWTGRYTPSADGTAYDVSSTISGELIGLVASYTARSSDIADASVTLSSSEYTYSGSAIVPDVTVTYSGTTLVKNTDYKVSCTDNINVGTATMTITGMGDYTGTITKTFSVKAQSLSSSNGLLSSTSYTYNGSARKPDVTVYNSSGVRLTDGTDYTVAYESGRENVGTYKVTITGTGNYTGTIIKTFTITAKSISSFTLKLSTAKYTYDGSAKKPSVTLKNGSVNISSGNYTVSYASGRRKCGRYKVTVTGKGNYTGSVSAYFYIKPAKAKTPVLKSSVKKQLKISWKKNSGNVTGYQIAYKVSGGSWKYITTKSTSRTIKRLKSGKKYTVKIRAYKTINGTKYYGSWSSTKTVKVK